MGRKFVLILVAIMLMLACLPHAAGTTIAFMSDARPKRFAGGEASLTTDLNVTDDDVVIGTGRTLDALVFVGDMDFINYSGDDNTEDAYEASEISSVPLFYVVGNHELDNDHDMPVLRQRFGEYSFNPNPGPDGARNTTYSFDVGDMHIVVLNQYWDGNNDDNCRDDWYVPDGGEDTDDSCFKYSISDGGYIPDELFDWLKSDLRNTTKPHKIVLGHEPAYPPAGGRHDLDSLNADITNRDKFWNLLRTERVVAHLSSHTHEYVFGEHNGIFEINTGRSGGMTTGDDFATIIYAYTDGPGNFEIRAAREQPSWASPNITTKTRGSIVNQTLINTWAGAGTVSRYFIDRNNSDEANPDWSANSNSQWWLPDFDDNSAGWNDGELGTGFDDTNPSAWDWINENISSQNGVYGIFQRVNFTVYNKSLYGSMTLGVDFDDAIIIWLNGVKIYESNNAPSVAANDVWDKSASSVNDSLGDEGYNPVYSYIDVTSYTGNLNDGYNLLAIGSWNYQIDSSDLISAVELVIQLGGDGPPTSILSYPEDNHITSQGIVTFECNATDYYNLKNVTIYVWNSTNDEVTTNSTSWTGTSNSTTFTYNFIYDDIYKWNCLVYDNVSQSDWATNRTLTITSAPANQVPNDPSPTLVSVDGTNSSTADLNCSSTITDPDSGDELNVTVQWYKDDVLNLTIDYNNSYANGTLFSAILYSGNTSVSDVWKCGMRLYDGQDYSNWVNSSGLTILDTTPPIVTITSPSAGQVFPALTISVTLGVSTDENALCRYNTTDVDYSSMPPGQDFGEISYTTSFSTSISVSAGNSYTYYVSCIDENGNENDNTNNAEVSFSVELVPPSDGGAPSFEPSLLAIILAALFSSSLALFGKK